MYLLKNPIDVLINATFIEYCGKALGYKEVQEMVSLRVKLYQVSDTY